MLQKLVLDLETQKEFSEVGGRNSFGKLRVSLCGVYTYKDDAYLCFAESELAKLGEILQAADLVIGYNIRQFDFAVLQPYYNFSLADIPTLDILEEIEKLMGHRIRLDAIAQATLGEGKTGSGLHAIELWRAGKIEELKSYCLNDVRLTKDLYDFAQKNSKLMFQDFFEVREIKLNFPEPATKTNVNVQRSLF